MIRAILFDMDGVIVDSEPIYFRRKKDFFNSIGIDVTDEQLLYTTAVLMVCVSSYFCINIPF